MRVLDSKKAIALLERAKKLLPGNDGILPQKYLSKDGMDAIIQGLREHTVDLDILANTIGLAGKKKDQDTLLAGFDHTHGDRKYLVDQPGEESIRKRHIRVIHIHPADTVGVAYGLSLIHI